MCLTVQWLFANNSKFAEFMKLKTHEILSAIQYVKLQRNYLCGETHISTYVQCHFHHLIIYILLIFNIQYVICTLFLKISHFEWL